MAQQESARTSASLWKSKRANVGNAVETFEKSGGGFFPRHKFDRHHTAFRVIEIFDELFSMLEKQIISGCKCQSSGITCT